MPHSDKGSRTIDPGQLGPGDVLARKYRLLSLLGQGATATVWIADNLALNTQVAVKVLRSVLISDPRLVARVRQEARTTASIAHKNIVQVFDFGITNQGAPFIIMELLRGETLADRLKNRGRLAMTEAVPIVLRAMKGVTVAHAKGIVHRDLKPENIFLAVDENGVERPKVLDFGVSFIAGEGAGSGQHFTRTGVLIGTPAYLPPEVIRAEQRADARADVWALGVLLYEMLAGRSPFVGSNIHTLMNAIVHDPPQPLKGVVPEVDGRLEAIIGRALAKRPDERFPTMRAFFDELSAWLETQYPDGSLSRFSQRMPHTDALDPVFEDDEGPTYVAGTSSEPFVVTAPPSAPISGIAREPRLLTSHPSHPSHPSQPDDDELPTRVMRPSPGPILSQTPTPSRASARPSSPLPLSPASLPPSLRARASVPAAPLPLVRGSSTQPVPLRSRSSLSRPWLIAALATFALVLGALVFAGVLLLRTQGFPFAGADVSLHVLAVPDHARVTVNGREVTLPVRVPRGATVQLGVEAGGYFPWQQEIIAEGAVRLTFSGIRRDGLPPVGSVNVSNPINRDKP